MFSKIIHAFVTFDKFDTSLHNKKLFPKKLLTQFLNGTVYYNIFYIYTL